MTERNFGRLEAFDERDELHLMGMVLPPAAPLPAYKYWVPGPILNQGSTYQCVAYAWHQWLETSPVRTKNGPEPASIYHDAQLIDEWPGEDPVVKGTSIRAGAKVMLAQGRIERYVWAAGVEDLKAWVLLNGPVVIGSPWYQGMMRTDADGYVHPSGTVVGGHGYLCIGYGSYHKAFRFVNSWGKSWGQGGRFWMHEADVAALLEYGSESCAAIEQKV